MYWILSCLIPADFRYILYVLLAFSCNCLMRNILASVLHIEAAAHRKWLFLRSIFLLLIELEFEPIKSFRVQTWSLKMSKYSTTTQSQVHGSGGAFCRVLEEEAYCPPGLHIYNVIESHFWKVEYPLVTIMLNSMF